MRLILDQLLQIAIAVDQLAHTLLGLIMLPFIKCVAYADETLSSRAYRWHRDGRALWPRRVIDALFFLQPDHCFEAYQSEKENRQLPPEFRD